MEPTTEQKKAVITALISEFQRTSYTHEVMGKTWQTIGNAEAAKKSAEALAEATKAIAELQRQLDALE